MITGFVILFGTLYLAFKWNGEKWLLWLFVGVAAVVGQLASYLANFLSRFRVGRSFPTAELRSKWVDSCENDWCRNLGRAPIVVAVFGLLAWWGCNGPQLGVPAQIGVAVIAWGAVVMGWFFGIRLRLSLNRRR